MHIKFDSRWKASHGIGRFASELLMDIDNESDDIVRGDFSSIFSPFDPVRLFWQCLIGGRAYFLSPSYNCPAFWSKRSIITLHDLMHLNFSPYASLKNRVYYNWLVKKVCQNSPLVFTVSEFTKSEIVEWAGISSQKVVVVPNGVDECYHPQVRPHAEVEPYIFYIGARKQHKNIERMLEAFSMSRFSKSHLFLLSGREDDNIKQLAEKLGIYTRIKFAGFIPEEHLPSYYRGASALMFASLYEGFGLPIIEAMAVGTPVITSNITAMPEVASDAAVFVDPYSIKSIQRGLDSLLSDETLRVELSQKGIVRASQFNWQKSREIWQSALAKLDFGKA